MWSMGKYWKVTEESLEGKGTGHVQVMYSRG